MWYKRYITITLLDSRWKQCSFKSHSKHVTHSKHYEYAILYHLSTNTPIKTQINYITSLNTFKVAKKPPQKKPPCPKKHLLVLTPQSPRLGVHPSPP